MDLYIKSLVGQIEMLTDFEVTRKNNSEGEKQISVSVTKTNKNEHAFPMIVNEARFIYDNEEYVIKQHNENITGLSIQIECTAIHQMFEDLNINHIYDKITIREDINYFLDFALAGTGYTYSVDPTNIYPTRKFVDYGDDNSLSLFKIIREKFKVEFEPTGFHIHVAKKISRNTDYQIRYKVNVSDLSQDIDTTDFRTYIRGYGKRYKSGNYAAQAEYTSPLAAIYGIKHATPVRDDDEDDSDSLLETIKNKLTDSMNLSIKLTYNELKSLGIQEIKKGDYVWCILDPFDLDVYIRVVEIEDYSNPFKSPIFTIGTLKRKATDIIASFNSTRKTVSKISDGTHVRSSAVIIDENTTFAEGYDPVTKASPLLATASSNGLMSLEDKTKLDQISISVPGQVVDLSFLMQKIEELEQRIVVLEGGGA